MKHEFKKDPKLRDTTRNIAYEIIAEKVSTGSYIVNELNVLTKNKKNMGLEELIKTQIRIEAKAEGMQIGEKKGMEIGEKKGFEKGKIEEKLAVMQNLLERNYRIDEILVILNINMEEFKELKAKRIYNS